MNLFVWIRDCTACIAMKCRMVTIHFLLPHVKARQLILDHGLNLSTLEEVPEVSSGRNAQVSATCTSVIWVWQPLLCNPNVLIAALAA